MFVDTQNKEKFYEKTKAIKKSNTSNPVSYSASDDLFQMESYSSGNSSASQNFQFNLDGLRTLINIIQEKFPVLKDGKEIVKKIDVNIDSPIILYGPPGTGKTFKMQNDYISKFDKENVFITTFHQSFSYEEFVEGLKPFIDETSKEITYKVEQGIFYKACECAAKIAGYSSLKDCIEDNNGRQEKMQQALQNNKKVLLCIDEINRANVSAVFGDLISLIENTKRIGAKNEMIVKLPYSKQDFGVPANLMIIGTMNTADRSIQLLDSALRRRFKFVELLPDYDSIGNEKAKNILKSINSRIRALLDKDHQIGHSYFIAKNTDLEIFCVMKENIIPLLEEYFYNETEKVRRILNEKEELKDEKSHSDDYFYILDTEAKKAIEDTDYYDEEKIYYKLNGNISKIDNDEDAAKILEHIIQQ